MSRPYIGPSESQSRAVYGRRFVPASFDKLVRWFVQGYRAEVPGGRKGDEYIGGVWRDRKRMTDEKGYEPVGGSALGAPRESEPLAAYLYDPTSRTEQAKGGDLPDLYASYATPMRWTVEWLERTRHPLMAAVLRRLGRTGDWHGLSVTCSTCSGSVTLPDEYAEAIARDALTLAAKHYREEPEARVA